MFKTHPKKLIILQNIICHNFAHRNFYDSFKKVVNSVLMQKQQPLRFGIMQQKLKTKQQITNKST